jgi:hypothetical protein
LLFGELIPASQILGKDGALSPFPAKRALVKKAMQSVQHRVAPRPKKCPLCKKSVTKADFDGKKATYSKVARRNELGLRWQHFDCMSRDARTKGRKAGGRPRSRS